MISGLGILSPLRLLMIELCIKPGIHVVIIMGHFTFLSFMFEYGMFFKFHGGCFVWKICCCNM